jgi:glycosyltransferase involved in cell wall biosynthesis
MIDPDKLNSLQNNSIPKISVVMPAYNAQDFIVDAIQSILRQTFTDFEFIIINDGSRDKTSEIVKSFSDPRIIFIDNKKHTGLVAVLNQGFDIARGQYIARMDSDDISLAQRFEKQISFMDKNTDVGVLGTWVETFGDNDIICDYPSEITETDVIANFIVAHPSVMIRKSVLDKYHFRYDPNFEACEDFELFARMFEITKICNLQEILVRYYKHKKSVCSMQRRLQIRNTKRVQKIILKRINSKP